MCLHTLFNCLQSVWKCPIECGCLILIRLLGIENSLQLLSTVSGFAMYVLWRRAILRSRSWQTWVNWAYAPLPNAALNFHPSNAWKCSTCLGVSFSKDCASPRRRGLCCLGIASKKKSNKFTVRSSRVWGYGWSGMVSAWRIHGRWSICPSRGLFFLCCLMLILCILFTFIWLPCTSSWDGLVFRRNVCSKRIAEYCFCEK